MTIGDKIKKRRKELHLTLEQVASYVGVAKTTIRAWELNQVSKISTDSIQCLSKILKCDPTYFIYDDNDDLALLNDLDDIDREIIKLVKKMSMKEKLDLYKTLIIKDNK